MFGYSHRDRRAHHDVGRAFWTVVGISLALTGLALAVPLAWVGIAAVVALGGLGAAYVGWSDRFLASYVDDLRLAREGSVKDGFLRVEAGSTIGLDRDLRSPASRSPHARRRSPGVRGEDAEPSLATGSESDQG